MSIEQVRRHYDDNSQREWERLDEHPFEFILTTYMMDRYVRPGHSILDVGGGPGRYAIHYAQQSAQVTLVDLSEQNIALAREKAAALGLDFPMHVANCLELDALGLGQFDHVFLMGPLYHLLEEADRLRAVQLAMDRLKLGGLLYCSFILDFAGVIYDLKHGPGMLPMDWEDPELREVMDSVLTGSGFAGRAFTAAHFINQRQIEPFMQQFPLEKLHLFGQEGILGPNEL